MGFSNVSRLAGGIVAYDRAISSGPVLADGDKAQESLFRGTNYVFDGRVGRAITDDAMGECVTCGEATGLATNCGNGMLIYYLYICIYVNTVSNVVIMI